LLSLYLLSTIHDRSARSRSKIYHFADTPKGVTRVMEIDLSDLPRETDPKVEKPSDLRGLRSTNINDIEEIRRLQEIKLTYIDILVPYTKRTLCKLVYGEATMKCPVDDIALGLMQTFAELNIYESNKAFANSGIDGRFRLAKAYMVDEDYDESSNSFPLILKHISTPDGVIDDVFSMRERWGADMVAFLVDQPDSCGLAFTGYPVSKDWTFAVVYWQCAAGYYSFVHELSHNLGANHDRDTEACPNTECCKKGCTNYGYRDRSMKFRTIMAYECPIYGGCPRIQMFSQPQLPYTIGRESFSVGNIVNDNAKQIRMSWDIVASYRKETNPLVIDSNPLLAPSNPQTPVPEAIARQSQQNSTKTQTQTQTQTTKTQTQTQKTQTTASKACGNGVCEPNHRENCLSCPGDCIGGIFKGTYCGDGICQYKENCVNCPEDCPGRDTGTEEQKFCCAGGFMPREPKKTGPGPLQKTVGCRHPYCRWNVFCDHNQIRYPEWNKGDPVKTFCCGNGKCEPGESNISCPTDCQGVDGITMLPKRCMTDGRYCVDITPDPCCGECNLDSRQCETSKK